MIKLICSKEDPYFDWIKKAVDESYSELVEDFGRELKNLKIIVFETQKEFQDYVKKELKEDNYYGKKWFIADAGTGTNSILLASPSDWPKEPKKRTYLQIKRIIKHELTHRFVKKKIPTSLNEGIAIYFANQKKLKRRAIEEVKRRKYFPSLFEKDVFVYYNLGPLFIKWLVKKYGKQELINFINSKGEFETSFKKVYKKSFRELEKKWREEDFKELKKFF